jgi:hypothetical protein
MLSMQRRWRLMCWGSSAVKGGEENDPSSHLTPFPVAFLGLSLKRRFQRQTPSKVFSLTAAAGVSPAGTPSLQGCSPGPHHLPYEMRGEHQETGLCVCVVKSAPLIHRITSTNLPSLPVQCSTHAYQDKIFQQMPDHS